MIVNMDLFTGIIISTQFMVLKRYKSPKHSLIGIGFKYFEYLEQQNT